MDRYKETFKTWNNMASLYEDKFMDLNLYDDTYDLFCNHLKIAKPKVLDIGCGPGNITKYVLSKIPNCDVLGIDIAPNMITLAQKNNPTAHFIQMDIRNIHRLNSKFTGIICGFGIPYLSKIDCKTLIENCADLLEYNGILYLSFVEGPHDASGYIKGSRGDRTYFYYHDLEYIKQELSKTNFDIVNTMNIDYVKKDNVVEMHTIIMARKQNI